MLDLVRCYLQERDRVEWLENKDTAGFESFVFPGMGSDAMRCGHSSVAAEGSHHGIHF